MRNFFRKLFIFTCVALLNFSCQIFKSTERQPTQASVGIGPETISTNPGLDEKSEEQKQAEVMVDQIIQQNLNSRQQLSSEIRSFIMEASWAQQLVSSFDMYLDFKLSKSSHDLEKPFALSESEINCKLWENSYFQTHAEEHLLLLQNFFLQKSDQQNYHWFLSFFKSSKADTPAQILAKAQLVRTLASNHHEKCTGKSCVDFLKFPGKPFSAFDPFNNQQMLDFKNKFSKKIAAYSPQEIDLMPKGQCFQTTSDRKPNTDEAPYNWKIRNKTGRKLNPKEYIITYDDGPHSIYTMQILEAWKKSGLAKPTFFWLAENVKKYPTLSHEVAAEGFEIAAHSYSHPDTGNLAAATEASQLNKVNRSLFKTELINITPENFLIWKDKMLDRQILESYSIIEKEVGSGKTLKFRLPYGSGVRNPLIENRFIKLNVDHYFWDIDSLDWQDKNPLTIIDRVHKQMQIFHKGIILFHDIHPQSIEASKLLIQEFLDNKNGKVLNLDEAHL